jgi:pyridoxal biosynthesis lyase PdxS
VIATAAKLSMVALLAAGAPVTVAIDTDAAVALWAQWGLAGVVVGYVLWRDWQRERRMATAIESQQKWIRETLLLTLERNAAVMEQVANWLDRQDHTERDDANDR